MVLMVEGAQRKSTGAFFDKYCNSKTGQWNQALANQEHEAILRFEEQLELATPEYEETKKHLGPEWMDLSSIDYVNKPFDQLGFNTCWVLKEFPNLLKELTELHPKIQFLAGLGIGTAVECCELLELPVKKLEETVRDEALGVIFDPSS